MEKEKKKGKGGKIIAWCITLAIIIGIIVALVVILMRPKETHTTTEKQVESIEILSCTSAVQNEPFFKSSKAIENKHEIKITFNNDKPEKYNYTYTGVFDSAGLAEEELSWLHADYNNYMGTTNVYQEALAPTFSIIDANAVINLYMSGETFTADTAKFIFLNNEQYAKIKNMSLAEVQKLYKNKSFNCTTKGNK